MTTGDEIVACSVEELPPGTRHEVLGAAKYGITVFNIAGEFYALLNFCPHKGGPLCRGRVLPHAISNEAGHWKFEREGEIIKCPYHNWEFDIKPGKALYADRLRARRFPVEVRDGQIVVRIRSQTSVRKGAKAS